MRAGPWWMAAGIVPTYAYQAKGAASLAASYVNLVGDPTYDAVPGANPPSLVAGGWLFNGIDQFLYSGNFGGVDADERMLMQYTTWNGAGVLFGVFDTSGGVRAFLIQAAGGPSMRAWYGDSFIDNPGSLLSGNYGLLNDTPARNGVSETPVTWGLPSVSLFVPTIGALNVNGTAAQFAGVTVSAFIRYGNPLTAGQLMQIALAMAAL